MSRTVAPGLGRTLTLNLLDIFVSSTPWIIDDPVTSTVPGGHAGESDELFDVVLVDVVNVVAVAEKEDVPEWGGSESEAETGS